MKLVKICLLLSCFTLITQMILPSASSAKLYSWKNKNGTVLHTDYPPPLDQVWKAESKGQNDQVKHAEEKSKVELFVTTWCPYCKKAIRYFQSKGIPFKVYNIAKDFKAAERKNKLDVLGGVPFAIVNGTYIRGYAPDQYAAALEK